MKTSPYILSTSLLAHLCAGATASALTMETVTVGDPGNTGDPLNLNRFTGLYDYGAVSYTYAIGKYEVTLNQYTEFLNAVAATDTYDLYHPLMAADPNIAGISRSGSSVSFTYAVIGDGQRPVTYVSWLDAARFTNWLHNGQPTGLQNASTTEDGAYTLNGFAATGLETKNVGALYWIPSENEWYKAAYYDPTKGGSDYWLYPTRSDSHPGNNIGVLPNQANFYDVG